MFVAALVLLLPTEHGCFLNKDIDLYLGVELCLFYSINSYNRLLVAKVKRYNIVVLSQRSLSEGYFSTSHVGCG